MALVVAVLLALLGLALIGLAILAFREDSPEWAYKIKRPGRLAFVGVLALVAALIVNVARTTIEDQVGDLVGQSVSCEKVGDMLIAGEKEDVYACTSSSGSNVGCFADVKDGVADVTRLAQATESPLQDRC
jgi:hypothetical protein